MTDTLVLMIHTSGGTYLVTVHPSRRVEITRDGERLSPDATLTDDGLRGGPELPDRAWEVIEHAVLTAAEAP